MKTAVIFFVAILFVVTLYCYFSKNCKNDDCGTSDDGVDTRANSIRRAKQNLHPTYNKSVERCKITGRYIKKS